MDIDKVIENLREAKRKSRCPKGFKYSKKLKSCIPIRKKGKYAGVRGYFGGHGRGDNRSDSGNGNGNGNGNGHGGNGNGNGNGGNGGGNGGGGE
tara:strand:+ start:201 stop:482 length:282 start_codon:yes stop_codon:yes gene_type:complete